MAYIGTSPSNGVRRRFVYEATASQTSFSGSDENGVTLTYVDSLYLDVFQNGIKLKAGDDYTATTGTSVVLVQGASANDVVEMVAFDIFSVGDTVSAKDGGNFAGNVAMAGTLAVTGNTTVGGTLGVTGNTTVGGTFGVTGVSTLSDNIVFGAASKGVYLGVTSATASNLLDDYEEGTWTPVATFGGGSSGITYSAGRQLGQYTKVGDTVHIYIHLQFTSKGSSTGALAITGLPFTVIGGGHHYIPAKTWIANMASLTETPTFRFVTATTTLDCYQMSSNTYSGITNSNCLDTSSFQISGQYYV